MERTILIGDALEVLKTLEPCSVNCCVTSPPYWGLRDYGVEGQLGLEVTPEEYVERLVGIFREVRRVLRDDGTVWLNLGDSYASSGVQGPNSGLAKLADRHAPRVNPRNPNRDDIGNVPRAERHIPIGLKPKDLVGIPWRVAFALQADGWWLRSDIIWSKPNPMPESVRDRPTKAHEYVFLFAKGQWKTRVIEFSDIPNEFIHFIKDGDLQPSSAWSNEFCIAFASAIFDCAKLQKDISLPRLDSEVWQQSDDGRDSDFVRSLPIGHRATILAARFLRSDSTTKDFLREMYSLLITLPDCDDFLKRWVPSIMATSPGVYRYGDRTIAINYSGKVCKFDFLHGNVSISQPKGCVYYYDHEAIKEPLGTQPNAQSRGPKDTPDRGPRDGGNGGLHDTAMAMRNGDVTKRNKRTVWTVTTKPFKSAHFAVFPPDLIRPCVLAGCPEGGTVLDPFFGAGTTGLVAKQEARGYIGIELNAEYAEMAKDRINGQCPMERLI